MFITIITGIIIFICTDFFKEFWFKYYQQFKELRADIVHALIFNANKYSYPSADEESLKRTELASQIYRDLAARLEAFIIVRPAFFSTKYSDDNIKAAARALIGLSNSLDLPCEERKPLETEICGLLNLKRK